jgi:uncharacterized iron-regulated protein
VKFKNMKLPYTLIAAMIFAACSQSSATTAGDPRDFIKWRALDYVLLGEVHDNERLHALRYGHVVDVATVLEGRPVILALEQFDVERQGALDQFLANLSEVERQEPATARKLAQAAGFNFEGWAWKNYEPTLQLALRRHWKVLAANLSRAQAMALSKGGASPLLENLNLEWTGQELARMAQEMQDGHCGLLPERAIGGMVKAQQARDAQMAKVVAQAKADAPGSLVLLLAGNGHVRKDSGVPRYLRALDPQATIFAWGFIETPLGEATSGSVYDEVISAAAQARPDPCEGLKEQMRGAPQRSAPPR